MRTVKFSSYRLVRRISTVGLPICIALALPTRSYAQFTGGASAMAQYESNSNVFALQSGVVSSGITDSRRSDTDYAYGAQFNGDYRLGRQDFYATASTKQFEYQHFTGLNHNDYALDAGLIWKLGDLLDGKLSATRNHTMVPLFNLAGSIESIGSLSILTTQQENAQIGLQLGRDWKLEGSGFASKSDQPIAEAPNLGLTQRSGTTSLQYVGLTGFSTGVSATYLSGNYSGTNGRINPSFNQSTAGLVATYKLSRTTFDGQAGYSRRTSSDGINDARGFTGSVDFKDQLTPKTNISLTLQRLINTYFLNLGSEIDTSAAAAVNWQATYKLAVSLGYTFTYRAYPGQSQGASYPVDYQQYGTLDINYQPRPWLQIRPYANIQTRRSNYFGRDFDATVFGVSITAMIPNGRR